MTPLAESAARVVQARVEESANVTRGLLGDDCLAAIVRGAEVVCDSLRAGGKLLVFGNGGSAADAEHIAGELVGRYLVDRDPLPALALGTQVAGVTAIANDYSYEAVFSRQITGFGKAGDVALALSTSGESANVVAGAAAAREAGLGTVALTGASGGALAHTVDVCIRVPSTSTPRIQEGHAVVGHILCEIVERELFDASAR